MHPDRWQEIVDLYQAAIEQHATAHNLTTQQRVELTIKMCDGMQG